jgi:hypothetical protein
MMKNIPEYDEDDFLIDNTISLIDGGKGSSGQEYCCFEQGRIKVWVNRDRFSPEPGPGILDLKRGRIKVFTAKQKAEISNLVNQRTFFPPMDIAERIGWNGTTMGYPDGTVFAAADEKPPVAYPTGAVCVDVKGTLEEWRENVAAFVQSQLVVLFCIMVSFAAPLLSLTRIQGNFAFMLSGPPRKGKTTCIDVAASVCGPALDAPGGRYYLKFNNTMNRIEELLPFYADLPLIIDELSSHGTKSSRVTDFRTLIHHLAGVDARGRFGDQLSPAVQTRTIILITSNDGAAELLSHETPDAADGAVDRLFEIPVPRGDEGVFNSPHIDYPDAGAFAEAIRDRVGQYHGTAMRVLLQCVAQRREDDENGLVAGINRRIAEFATLPEVTALGPVSSRALAAFGLVAAAGALAKHYKVLPTDADPVAAAVHCLKLHLGARVEADPVQRLLSWAAVNRLIDLRGGDLPRLSTNGLKRRGAFIGECRGVAQLWVAPSLLEDAFPNARSLLKSLATLGILKREGSGASSHLTGYKTVRENKKKERVHIFAVPEFEDWLDANGYPRPKRRKR